MTLTSLELCAGGGGQALGLEKAGFSHVALVDNDRHACATLRTNRPFWNTIETDLKNFDATQYRSFRLPNGKTKSLDLLSGGTPCPPFSVAGRMLGVDDPRNLFSEFIRIAQECEPHAVMIENVRGLMDPSFDTYRSEIEFAFSNLGYKSLGLELLQSSSFGVPQLRPRVVFIALRPEFADGFKWPVGKGRAPTVGTTLHSLMATNGWRGADAWAKRADAIAPTLVGGSKLHGGPDLGPSRARAAWEAIGVNGKLIADEPPSKSFRGMPCLTVEMAALIQGFDPEWQFVGSRTHAYRQVGNAFPPPVARALGNKIRQALTKRA